jgi:hypothetical protein
MTPYGVPFPSPEPLYLARFFQDVVNGATVSPEITQVIAQHNRTI